jgi:hypothetical protein
MYPRELKVQKKNPGGALWMSHLWNTKCYARVFCQVLFWCLSTPHFVKLSNPAIHFVISQFCQLHFSCLPTSLVPNCEVYIAPSSFFLFANFHFCQIARSKLPNFQVCILKCRFSSCGLHITILLFCQITKSTSPFRLPKWASTCPSLIS